eukprot:Amastigsp_a175620_30.p3 type:complete len:150 gc:universal Amastigsp_a175620_30:330-779(+)
MAAAQPLQSNFVRFELSSSAASDERPEPPAFCGHCGCMARASNAAAASVAGRTSLSAGNNVLPCSKDNATSARQLALGTAAQELTLAMLTPSACFAGAHPASRLPTAQRLSTPRLMTPRPPYSTPSSPTTTVAPSTKWFSTNAAIRSRS